MTSEMPDDDDTYTIWISDMDDMVRGVGFEPTNH